MDIERARKVLTSRVGLLRDLYRDPKRFKDDVRIVNGLSKQGRFAQLKYSDYGIEAVSLNSLKSYANADFSFEEFAGDSEFESNQTGFSWLDQFRKEALIALLREAEQEKKCRPHRTLETLGFQLKEKQRECDLLQEELTHISFAFDKALNSWKLDAKRINREAAQVNCLKEQKELLDTFSPFSSKIDDLSKKV